MNLKLTLKTMVYVALLLVLPQNLFSAKVYNEVGGILMMEAENTESSLDLWKTGTIVGSSGIGNLEFTGNTAEGTGSQRSPLQYKFKISTAGDYTLFIKGRRSDQFTEDRKDIANDAYVRVEGDYTVGAGSAPNVSYLKENEKMFIGRGGYQDGSGDYDWRWGDKLDIDGLAEAQPHPIYSFKAGETYTLVVSGRSTYFCLDRIVFSTTSNATVAKALTIESSSFDDGGVVERYAYEALNHFTAFGAGEVPFYKDNARNALSVDASIVANRDKFALATTIFTGKTDKYDVTLTTLSESDGECSYRFLVNGKVVGTYQNTLITTADEYNLQTPIFKAITISKGDVIGVEANTHTNKLFPEGNDGGTAWARGRWSSISMKPAIYQGRIAIVADGNFRDSDDLIGTPVTLAMLRAFGLNRQLVHYSHSCDLKPGANDPGGDYRQDEMQISCDGTASRWGGFDHLTFYNCMTQKAATIADLTVQINASTEIDPLWIIEAGEPDIMWEAMNKCEVAKRKYVFIVTHHPANDKGDDYDLSDVMALGVPSENLHSIPDQNTLLKSPLSDWYWARDHEDDRIKWLWERGVRAQSADMNYPAIVGKFDCSDAGMIYYWCTIDGVADASPDVAKLKTLFLDYLASAPSKVAFVSPKANETVLPSADLVIVAELMVDAVEIDSVTLFINDVAVSTRRVAPFVWGNNDAALQNIQPGTYNMKLVATDTAEVPSEAYLKVLVPDYAYFISPKTGDEVETGSNVEVTVGLNTDTAKIASLALFRNDTLVRKITEAPFTWGANDAPLTNMVEGVYDLKLVATTTDAETSEAHLSLMVKTTPVQEPYTGTSITIPGKFEAEDYDLGGEGVAYHDTDDSNQNGEHRTDGIDIGTGGSGFVIGYTNGGEYMEYTIEVAADGQYDIIMAYSSGKPTGGGTIIASFPDEDKVLVDAFVLPKTDSWGTYATITLANVTLAKGEHILRFMVKTNGFNMDWFELMRTDGAAVNELKASAISVFPNPSADGCFTLNEWSTYDVYSALGVKMASGEGSTVDISKQIKGVYFLRTEESISKIVFE